MQRTQGRGALRRGPIRPKNKGRATRPDQTCSMAAKPLDIHTEALAEFRSAVLWYLNHSEGLTDFPSSVHDTKIRAMRPKGT